MHIFARSLYEADIVSTNIEYYVDYNVSNTRIKTSGYATWFTAGGAIRIAQYDVIDDVITRKL